MVIKKLSKGYQCIAKTHPDLGRHQLKKKPSIQAFAEFVQKELEAREIKKFSLVGHSMGGEIAMQIALMLPKIRSGN